MFVQDNQESESRSALQSTFQDKCPPSAYPSSGTSPATGVVVDDVLPDGTVDIADLSALAGQYPQDGTGLLADLNCDEVADALVLSMLMTLWCP